MLTVFLISISCLFSVGSNVEAKIKCSNEPTDIIFLVDDSDSLKDSDFKRELLCVNQLISFFDLGPDLFQVGVTTFSTDVHTYIRLGTSNDKKQIYSTVGNISPSRGATFLGKALNYVLREGFTVAEGSRNEAQKVLIVITDGDAIDPDDALMASSILKALNIKVFIIGIGANLNQATLQRIVSGPETLFKAIDFNELPKIAESLKKSVCKNTITCKTTPADVIFALDTSDSVIDSDFNKMLDFVQHFVSGADINKDDVRVGLFTFADTALIQIALSTFNDKDGLVRAVGNIKRDHGSTNTEILLEKVRSYWFDYLAGGRPNGVRKILIVITDGDSIQPDATAAEARILQALGVEVFALGIGEFVSYPQLLAMAGKKENVFPISKFGSLSKIEKEVFQMVCTSKPLDIPTTTAPVVITTRRSSCSDGMIDMVFLLDSSKSTTPSRFQKAIFFVRQFILRENIGPDSIHLSVVTFATDPRLDIRLNTHTTKGPLIDAVGRLQRLEGSTNTAKALTFVKTNTFASWGGARLGAKKVVAVITNGQSDDLFETDVAAQSLRSEGVTIFSIVIGNGNVFELEKIAGNPANVITISDYPIFHDAFNKISC